MEPPCSITLDAGSISEGALSQVKSRSSLDSSRRVICIRYVACFFFRVAVVASSLVIYKKKKNNQSKPVAY